MSAEEYAEYIKELVEEEEAEEPPEDIVRIEEELPEEEK